jgi:hypothetical protein
MSTQPEALRLAYLLEVSSDNPTLINVDKRCAAELRRLHEVNQELLEALCCVRDMVGHPDNLAFIDNAITKATGENK